jgi:endonuclease/exonuclease/phosphatase (EEP) superfamily protein YafD
MKPGHRNGLTQFCAYLAITLFLGGCITLTEEPRAIVYGSNGDISVASLNCEETEGLLQKAGNGEPAGALDPNRFRVLVWNIHKQSDGGWDRDLIKFAGTSDVLMLQEVISIPSLREILLEAGMRLVMASSFLYESNDTGVLVASRVAPLASCTQRSLEPIIRIPKSVVLSWLQVAGRKETLVVANIHAINFEIGTVSYGAQIASLAGTLSRHNGPILVAGDFNTWSDERERLIVETFTRLGMVEVRFSKDERSLFIGKHLDHIYTRGLEILDSGVMPVVSSDHNPIIATFQIP